MLIAKPMMSQEIFLSVKVEVRFTIGSVRLNMTRSDMRKIWKYDIDARRERFSVSVPKGATFLTAQVQHGKPVMWAMVETEEDLENRYFVLLETGAVQNYQSVLGFIATLQLDDGKYVVHLFEEER